MKKTTHILTIVMLAVFLSPSVSFAKKKKNSDKSKPAPALKVGGNYKVTTSANSPWVRNSSSSWTAVKTYVEPEEEKPKKKKKEKDEEPQAFQTNQLTKNSSVSSWSRWTATTSKVETPKKPKKDKDEEEKEESPSLVTTWSSSSSSSSSGLMGVLVNAPTYSQQKLKGKVRKTFGAWWIGKKSWEWGTEKEDEEKEEPTQTDEEIESMCRVLYDMGVADAVSKGYKSPAWVSYQNLNDTCKRWFGSAPAKFSDNGWEKDCFKLWDGLRSRHGITGLIDLSHDIDYYRRLIINEIGSDCLGPLGF